MPRCYMVKTGNKHPPAPSSPSLLNNCQSNELSASPNCILQYASLTNRSDLSKSSNKNKKEEIVFASDVGIPIFKSRSVEDTEAANDLLSLSQSLPPLPPPSVIIQHTVPLEEVNFPSSSCRYKALSDDKEMVSLSDGENSSYNPQDDFDYPKSSNHRNLEYSKDPLADQECSILESNDISDKLTTFNESNLYTHRTKNSNNIIMENDENDDIEMRYEDEFEVNENEMSKHSGSTSPEYYQNTSVVVQNRNPVIVENRNYVGNKEMEQKRHQDLHYLKEKSSIDLDNENDFNQIESDEYDRNELQIVEIVPKIVSKRQSTGRQPRAIAPKTHKQSKAASTKYDKTQRVDTSPLKPTTSKNKVVFIDIPDGRRRKIKNSKKNKNNDSNNNKEENENYGKKNDNKSAKRGREKTKFFKVADEPFEDSAADGTYKRNKFICAQCGKCYATSSNLSRHKQTHRSLDSHSAKKCETCGKLYVSMPALSMHLLTHRLGYSCEICNKQFSRIWLLHGHLRSHTGEKPFGCAHCGKAFADRSNLRAHMQTHSNEKRFECPKCHKTFALKSYLNKHFEATCVNWENPDDEDLQDTKDYVQRNVETQTFDD